MLKTEEQVAQEAQAAQQAQAQALQQQAQLNVQAMQMQENAKAQAEIAVEKEGDAQRENRGVERPTTNGDAGASALLNQGNVLNPVDLQQISLLLREEQFDAQQQVQQQQMMQEQQAIAAEDQRHNQVRQETMARMGRIADEARQRGQQRMQGGPDAQDMLKEQQAENAVAA